MTITRNIGDKDQVLGKPVLADGATPSSATLSSQAYSSDNIAVFTVDPDPNNAGGDVITAVGAGTATLKETATATETDGRTGNIQGLLTVIVNAPLPPQATEIVFTVTPIIASGGNPAPPAPPPPPLP